MIERNDAIGATAVYLGPDWEPEADADSATLIKLVFDDGRVMFLTPDAPEPENDGLHEHHPDAWNRHRAKQQGDEPAPEPEDDSSHEHHADAWNRHRAKHGAKPPQKIYGKSLAGWARTLLGNDLKMIRAAIEHGVRAGDSSSDIAHRVIGSRALNGRNGVTEQTRQHIIRLGRGYLRKHKTRMGGASTDGPAK